MSWLRKLSIRWQLICAVAFVHAVLMTIFVVGTVAEQREFLMDKARQHVEFQARLLSDSSEHLVMTNDVQAIDEVLSNLAQDTHIRFAMVTTPDGVVLAHTSPKLEGTTLVDPASIDVLHGPLNARVYMNSHSMFGAAAPIRVSSGIIGWAWVGREFSDDLAYLRYVVVAGLLYTLLAAMLGTVVAIFLANKLLMPLKLLLAGATRLANDRLEEPIPLVSGDEIGTVTAAFNSAMQKLAEQRNALRKEVADRVHAEHELHQIYGLSHRRAAELNAVIESLPEAVYIGTEQGLTKCNAKAMSLLKVASLKELSVLHEMHVLMHAADRQPLSGDQTPFSQALRGIVSVTELILQERGTSVETYIRVAAAPVYQNGQIVGAVSVATDVTTEKLEQEKLRKAKAEAEEANQAKDQFLAVLSHELRTPLTPVLTLAQLMERDPELSEETREDIITIRRNVELEAQLIDDLLDLTRISRGKVELHFEAVDIHEKLRQVVRMCESQAAEKSLDLVVELTAERFTVEGDATRVQQVFWNLLRNAIKFTRRGDRIAIRTRVIPAVDGATHDELSIEVADTGIGIEPAALQRVFEAFEQGGREITRAFGGLGLGLTISKAMVDLHHGKISATSDGKDRGATFSVLLPLKASAAAIALDSPRVTTELSIDLKSTKTRLTRRILLVEDHADTSKATARLLNQCGYQVQTAAAVAEAIQLARAHHFDLIISDIGLPDGTGHDLIRQLVAEAPQDGDAVLGIAMSGFGQASDLQRSLDAGFVEHLVKPVNPSALLHAVDDVLQNGESNGVGK